MCLMLYFYVARFAAKELYYKYKSRIQNPSTYGFFSNSYMYSCFLNLKTLPTYSLSFIYICIA